MTLLVDQRLADYLLPGPAERWRRWRVGTGAIALDTHGLRLLLPRASGNAYSNAQLDDYHGLPHRRYPWRPPLRLTVRACFGGPLLGTAGFGLWNHPFLQLGSGGVPLLPRAVWFFHASPPNNMALAHGVPGHGWKTATLDALRARAIRWAPFAPAVMALNRVPALERRMWPLVERDLAISEHLIAAEPRSWHDYTLVWRHDGVQFAVDGETVHETARAPRGPLGFVAWIDNQYAITTRWGHLGYGVLDISAPQYLDLAHVQIEPL
jgi:hypothetical protein